MISCGKNTQYVSDLSATTSFKENDLYLGLNAKLNIGNISLPSATFPVYYPKTWESIGSVQMQGISNQLKINLNLSAIANLEAKQSLLPNGITIPIIGSNKVIEIPVANKLILYVSLGEEVAALGVSIAFKTLDSIGAKVGTTGVFPMFNINKIMGSAGIYTSRQQGLNGLALFADVTNVIATQDYLNLTVTPEVQKMEYIEIETTKAKRSEIDLSLFKFHKQNKILRLH